MPLKLDGARLGDVGIKITPDEKILVDAKLLKIYLGKIFIAEVLEAALKTGTPEQTQWAATTVAGKKLAGETSSSMAQLVSHTEEKTVPGELGREKPDYLGLDVLKQRGVAMRYDPTALELVVEPGVDQRMPGDISFAPQAEMESAAVERRPMSAAI